MLGKEKNYEHKQLSVIWLQHYVFYKLIGENCSLVCSNKLWSQYIECQTPSALAALFAVNYIIYYNTIWEIIKKYLIIIMQRNL